MAVFKCKMCGGTLEIIEGQTVVTCDFCGTKQTVPSFDNEKKITLFKRANEHRFRNEFDKASGIYETIISDFPNEAEAYWGLVLCRYGIEYVDDPKTGEKIPTCHRTQYDSIFDDPDYKNALKNADVVAREIYKSEAERISFLQKGILEISSKEDPFDIFICYKETDEHGERTIDSVLAQDIYKELTNEGYRVFFSRITLEDKLGSEYEPYIFAALHSARIMLHVTTNVDYSESVWVRNEWSRFLDLSKNGQKKTLIPCYKNITAYDLPVEMQNLQGQDMSKLGSMQDLIRGISKILPKETSKNRVTNSKSQLSEEQELFESHLRKANIYLSKGLWNEAIEGFNNAIKLTKYCGRAYIGLMLAEAKETDIDSFLRDRGYDCDELSKLKLAESCADELCKKELEEIKKKITELVALDVKRHLISLLNNEEWDEAKQFIEQESERKNEFTELYKKSLYEACKNKLNNASNISDISVLDDVVAYFEELGKYNDSISLIKAAKIKKTEIIEQYEEECISKLIINHPQEITLEIIESISQKIIDNKTILSNFELRTESLEKKYKDIEEENCKFVLNKSQSLVNSLSSSSQCNKLRRILDSLNRKNYFEPVYNAISEKEREFRAIAQKQKAKKKKITLLSCGIVVALVGATIGTVLGVKASSNNKQRAHAIELMEKGSYSEAISVFEALGDYRDAKAKIDVCRGLINLDNSIETKSENDAYDGVKKIILAGESVSISYSFIEKETGNSNVFKETISSPDFKFYTPTVNNGYSVSKWYSINVEYKNDLTYLTLDSIWAIDTYTISYDLDGGENNPSNPTLYTVEEEKTLYEATKTGYTFMGWYNGSTKIDFITKGTYGNLILKAGWKANDYQVIVINNNESLGSIVGGGTYSFDSSVTLTAKPIGDNVFIGWYSNASLTSLLSTANPYTFNLKAEGLTVYAKILTKAEAEEETKWNKAHGVIPVYNSSAKTITYGLYPQTNVNDANLISALNALTTPESNGWYLYESEYYAKVNARTYGYNCIFDNGVEIVEGTTYWFKCEPIVWNVLSNNNGNYYLLSSVLLDCHIYNKYVAGERSNNYERSEIRAWLNADFYNSAFMLDNDNILTTLVDNSQSSLDPVNDNKFVCDNTNDKIFMPSTKDYKNTNYGFASNASRCCKTTDWARANYISNRNNNYAEYWTRSPYEGPYSAGSAYVVMNDGSVTGQMSVECNFGVRPALTLTLNSI